MILKELTCFDLKVRLQILERKGVTRKILRNKDLATVDFAIIAAYAFRLEPSSGIGAVEDKVRCHMGVVENGDGYLAGCPEGNRPSTLELLCDSAWELLRLSSEYALGVVPFFFQT